MGRTKIEIKEIEKASKRHITYSKRSKGFLKKAHELSVLCEAAVLVMMFSPSEKLTLQYGPGREVDNVLQRFANTPHAQRFASTPQQKRTKRRNENLERNELAAEQQEIERLESFLKQAQEELAVEQQEIEYLESCLKQAQEQWQMQPLENLIGVQVMRCGSNEEVDRLEYFIKTGFSKVMERKYSLESTENMTGGQVMTAPQNCGKLNPMMNAGVTNSAKVELQIPVHDNADWEPVPDAAFVDLQAQANVGEHLQFN